jgi:hypothetical protein
MIVLYLQALAAIAAALSVSMAGVRRTGDSRGGVPRKLFIFLQNQGFGSVPLPPREGVVA